MGKSHCGYEWERLGLHCFFLSLLANTGVGVTAEAIYEAANGY